MRNKGLFFLLTVLIFCPSINWSQEIRGLSFVGTRDRVGKENLITIKKNAANWVALMPYGYMKSARTPMVSFNVSWQWQGETKNGIEQAVPFFQREGISVMLKPHIWIKGGIFTGTISFDSPEEWNQFQESYRKFILHFAQVAEETKIPMLCIGTELQSIVANNPEYWRQLIREIKQVYTGKLTYAENWDQFQNVPFWDQLDYVGIDAYFPLKTASPTVTILTELWKPYVQNLKGFSEKYNRKILFTEMGYRSINLPTSKPWDYSLRDQPFNGQTQADALEALFISFENKSWWAGGFIWKWFPDYANSGGTLDTTFSPQNKPAVTVIERYFTNWQ